jgi:NADH-quinone oxidoreductase subunit N
MLAVLIIVALAGGLAALSVAGQLPGIAAAVGLGTAAAALVLSLSLKPEDSLLIGTSALASSAAVRLLAIAWAGGLVLLGLLGGSVAARPAATEPGETRSAALPSRAAREGRRAEGVGGRWSASAAITGPGLVTLAAGLLALTVDDPTVAFAALAIGGLVAILVPALASRLVGRDEAPVAMAAGSVLATVGAGLGALVLVAWSQSGVGPLGSGTEAGIQDPALEAAVGLAVIAMAGAVILRSGAIPAHLWAARLVGGVPAPAVPSILGWGAAAFTLVAVAWSQGALAAGSFALDDLDRWVVVAVALASVLLGGLAAMLHDDLEHVLGYSIVQDAGVALFAFAALRGEVAGALATWLIATAALKTALAGWIATTRWAFGAHRVSELHGWARRAPLLGLAYLLVLLGSIGLPGTGVFDARVALIGGALPGWLGTLVVIAALSPIVALGRLFAAGLQAASPDVAAASPARLGRFAADLGTWSRGGPRWWLRTGAAMARTNEGFGVAVASVLLAVLGLAVAIVGVGGPAA